MYQAELKNWVICPLLSSLLYPQNISHIRILKFGLYIYIYRIKKDHTGSWKWIYFNLVVLDVYTCIDLIAV